MQWAVFRVESARDIACEDDTGSGFSGVVNALEDRVGCMITAASLPPSFHNSFVISINLKTRDWVGL